LSIALKQFTRTLFGQGEQLVFVDGPLALYVARGGERPAAAT